MDGRAMIVEMVCIVRMKNLKSGQYTSISCSIFHTNGIPKHFIACSIK